MLTSSALKNRLNIAALCCAALVSAGCGPSSATQPSSGHDPAGAEAAVAATGWEKVSMIANWAKTSLDPTGHFITSRNACGKPAEGAITLEQWNKLTKAINRAVTLTPLAENKCVDIPRTTKMDGLAEVQLNSQESSKIQLIDARGYQLCSKIPDEALSNTIYEGLAALVDAADKEECANGWGSN